MHKILKILPIVMALSVMLCSGIIVNAAHTTEDISAIYDIYRYCNENDIVLYEYCYLHKSVSDTSTTYAYVNSEYPLEYSDRYFVNSEAGWVTTISYTLEAGVSNCSARSVDVGAAVLFIGSQSAIEGISNYDVSGLEGTSYIEVNPDFFPRPLLVKAAEILPTEVQSQTIVIIPTAVCCLALLISLVALRKRLPIFLPR